MSEVIAVGIDPGVGGALAFVRRNGDVTFEDMPLAPARYSLKRNQLDPVRLSEVLFTTCGPTAPHIFVELVNAMPPITGRKRKPGAMSMFGFGYGAGLIEGVLAADGWLAYWYRPADWKRRAGLWGQPKDAALARAVELYPAAAPELRLQKHIGRADALLIAHVGIKEHDL